MAPGAVAGRSARTRLADRACVQVGVPRFRPAPLRPGAARRTADACGAVASDPGCASTADPADSRTTSATAATGSRPCDGTCAGRPSASQRSNASWIVAACPAPRARPRHAGGPAARLRGPGRRPNRAGCPDRSGARRCGECVPRETRSDSRQRVHERLRGGGGEVAQQMHRALRHLDRQFDARDDPNAMVAPAATAAGNPPPCRGRSPRGRCHARQPPRATRSAGSRSPSDAVVWACRSISTHGTRSHGGSECARR